MKLARAAKTTMYTDLKPFNAIPVKIEVLLQSTPDNSNPR